MTKDTQRAHCSLQWSAKKSASAFYTLDPQKKIHSDRPHFTRTSIRRSADPHFTGSRN